MRDRFEALPKLEEVLGRPVSKAGRVRPVLLRDISRVARRLKGSRARPFYSMREMARFFDVSLTAVADAYRVLESEGVLTRIRGTHTVLNPRVASSRRPVRGVIGVPMWLPAIIALPYTTTFVMELEDRVRRSGYVADFIFHSMTNEEAQPNYAERLLNHQLDAVIFHTPDVSALPTLKTLSERGVRMLTVLNVEDTWAPPGMLYYRVHDPAYGAMADSWREAGIRHAWWWTYLQAGPSNQIHYQRLAQIFGRRGIKLEPLDKSPEQLLREARRSRRSDRQGLLFGLSNEDICNAYPQTVERLSSFFRFGFSTGRVRSFYMHRQQIRFDYIDCDPVDMARQLAADVHQLSTLPDGPRHTFRATYHAQGLL